MVQPMATGAPTTVDPAAAAQTPAVQLTEVVAQPKALRQPELPTPVAQSATPLEQPHTGTNPSRQSTVFHASCVWHGSQNPSLDDVTDVLFELLV